MKKILSFLIVFSIITFHTGHAYAHIIDHHHHEEVGHFDGHSFLNVEYMVEEHRHQPADLHKHLDDFLYRFSRQISLSKFFIHVFSIKNDTYFFRQFISFDVPQDSWFYNLPKQFRNLPLLI